MKIKNVTVEGLLGRKGKISLNLNEDINIITGKNGAGKTTFLKLLWFVISGNITQAIEEIEFSELKISTSEYLCIIRKYNDITCRASILLNSDEKIRHYEDSWDEARSNVVEDARDTLSKDIQKIGSSLFFPTFRRIEGGFSTRSPKTTPVNYFASQGKGLEEALSALSSRLSKSGHTFVSSISTADIESLILRKYTDLSESANSYQNEVNSLIINQISSYKVGESGENVRQANDLIDSIQKNINKISIQRKEILKPIDAVRELVEEFFHHSGIRFGKNINFGDAAKSVNSDLLSAGEKQLLSFICYNGFTNDAVIFIDEPELSLHVDWQRAIVPRLLRQNSGNQFIISTHSPFIYAKYPEKELSIDNSFLRGNEKKGGNIEDLDV